MDDDLATLLQELEGLDTMAIEDHNWVTRLKKNITLAITQLQRQREENGLYLDRGIELPGRVKREPIEGGDW